MYHAKNLKNGDRTHLIMEELGEVGHGCKGYHKKY